MRDALLTLALAAGQASAALPSFEQVRGAHRVSDLQLLDRHGQPLQTLRLDKQHRTLAWVPLQHYSPALLHALLLSEDKHFYEHSGVDWGAVAASAWGNLWNERTRGASTLTMQLAGLIDQGLARPRQGRSAMQKLGQAVIAQQLERSWSKAQILEAYLNRVPLRGELVGVPAAARLLFDKSPAALDARESALLASLLRAPNAKVAAVSQRACALLAQQQAKKTSDCPGLELQAAAAFARRPPPLPGEQLAPHYARLALKPDGPNEQRSTLDAGLQRLALQTLRQQLLELQGRNVEDGAVVVLDNASGEILAWVGSSGAELSNAAEVDGVLARRQPGSTLKPFVYQLALEKKLITAASLLDDSPAQISTAAGLYLPQNYDRGYRGWVSTRAALGNSLNIPAVRVGAMLGADPLAARLNALGLDLPQGGSYYGASLALGSAEVSLIRLANAYRALANGGLYRPVRLPGSAVMPARRVADAASSFVVSDILADNNARALTFGLDSLLATGGWAAVKTGTSKDMRDNWCLGFSDRYTVGVWVGNAGGEAMHQVSGVSGAAPVWARLMRELQRERVSRAPQPPAGLLSQQLVRFEGAQAEPARQEWFVRGTELARVAPAEQPLRGIANPRDGAIYALDPDIPPAAQRIVFEGEAGQWKLDGKLLGRGTKMRWAPMPGRHQLALLDTRGQVLQTVAFEVRGASLAPPRR
ncbi:penicillin-binding protein 1C [Pelomonas sp. SE-A7]|uniref:penicillin-binding protein 1C n=1 Tax=Pelomonas sp. SE-A7 TaxID=3054953 RepID=UPI00259CB5A4|nr:penicillin-binding protein 1C [Pelomonas sp. SE-A7]MDM4766875.1 penicillin-binding protein 1C [Pelomonas sp. SE-A7]